MTYELYFNKAVIKEIFPLSYHVLQIALYHRVIKAPLTSAVYQEVQVLAACPGKTGNRFLFGQRIEQRAYTSQSQFAPVCAALKSSWPLPRAGTKKREHR